MTERLHLHNGAEDPWLQSVGKHLAAHLGSLQP